MAGAGPAAPGIPNAGFSPQVGPTVHGSFGYDAMKLLDEPKGYSFSGGGMDPITAYFGLAEGQRYEGAASLRNIGLRTMEDITMGVHHPVVSSLNTFKYVTAQGHFLIDIITDIEITYEHSTLFKQVSTNLIPAQPAAHMTLARNNTRNVIQYLLSSERRHAGAMCRFEELEGPGGQETADWMIDSVNHSLIFDLELEVLGALVSEGMLRYNLQTDGDRNYKFWHPDRQMLEDTNGFGLLNKSLPEISTELARRLGEVPHAERKVLVLPYGMLGLTAHLKTADIQNTLAHLTIAPDVAANLGFNITQRVYTPPASIDGTSAYAIGDSDAIVLFAPPGSMNAGESETPGILDSMATIANYFRNGAYGAHGNNTQRTGDLLAYDDSTDKNELIAARNALANLGIWRQETHVAKASDYRSPGHDEILAGFTDHVHNYFDRIVNNPAPSTAHYINNPSYLAGQPRRYMDPIEAKAHKDIPVFITYADNKWHRTPTIGSMYHQNLTHADALLTTAGIVKHVTGDPGLSNTRISVEAAFMELDRIILQIQRQQYNNAWAARVVKAAGGVQMSHDGVRELKCDDDGSISVPTYKGLLDDHVTLDRSFLCGFWTGPMLRSIARTADHVVKTWPQWAQEVHAQLKICLPVVDRALELFHELCPESAALSRNSLPLNLQRRDYNPLTAYVAHKYGDSTVFCNAKASLRISPALAGATADVAMGAFFDAIAPSLTGWAAPPDVRAVVRQNVAAVDGSATMRRVIERAIWQLYSDRGVEISSDVLDNIARAVVGAVDDALPAAAPVPVPVIFNTYYTSANVGDVRSLFRQRSGFYQELVRRAEAGLLLIDIGAEGPDIPGVDITPAISTDAELAELFFFNGVNVLKERDLASAPGIGNHVRRVCAEFNTVLGLLNTHVPLALAPPGPTEAFLSNLTTIGDVLRVCSIVRLLRGIADVRTGVANIAGLGAGGNYRAAWNAITPDVNLQASLTAMSEAGGFITRNRAVIGADQASIYALLAIQILIRLRDADRDGLIGTAASADRLQTTEAFRQYSTTFRMLLGNRREITSNANVGVAAPLVRTNLGFSPKCMDLDIYKGAGDGAAMGRLVAPIGFIPSDPDKMARDPINIFVDNQAIRTAIVNRAQQMLQTDGTGSYDTILRAAHAALNAPVAPAAGAGIARGIPNAVTNAVVPTFAPRSAYQGAVIPDPNGDGANDPAFVTSNLLQANYGSEGIRELMHMRHKMKNVVSPGGLLHQLAYDLLMFTPMTYNSIKRLFGHADIQPPFDIGFFKWCQRFETSDVVVTTARSCNTRSNPIVSLITKDTAHKLVQIEGIKRSMTYCKDKSRVYLIRSAHVRRCIAGRANGFVQPGKKYEPISFRAPRNAENVLAVAESLNRPWRDLIHYKNQPNDDYMDRAIQNQRLTLSYWTEAEFAVEHAFREYFEYPIEQMALFTADQVDVANNRKDTGLQFRQRMPVMNFYALRGQYYIPNHITGDFNVKVQGSEYSPLGTEFWNMDGFKKMLNNPNNITPPTNVISSSRY